jgi:hypothetical protein
MEIPKTQGRAYHGNTTGSAAHIFMHAKRCVLLPLYLLEVMEAVLEEEHGKLEASRRSAGGPPGTWQVRAPMFGGAARHAARIQYRMLSLVSAAPLSHLYGHIFKAWPAVAHLVLNVGQKVTPEEGEPSEVCRV